MLEDEPLRRQLRLAGPLRAAGWPTVDEMVDRILACYLDLNFKLTAQQRKIARDTPSDPDDHAVEG